MPYLVELTNTKLTKEQFDFIKAKLKDCTCERYDTGRRSICDWCDNMRKRWGHDPYISVKLWTEYRDSHLSVL